MICSSFKTKSKIKPVILVLASVISNISGSVSLATAKGPDATASESDSMDLTEPQSTSIGELSENEMLMEFYKNENFSSGSSTADSNQDNYGLDSVDADFHALGDILQPFNNACDKVANEVAETVFNLVTPRLLDGPKDILAACPQWPNLSEHDRKDFYIGLVTAMALAESSCNNKVKARGVNSTAYGLWQGTRPRTPTEGAKWVMKQIDSQVQQSGLLFWGNSLRNYWAVLNPRIHAFKVQRMLSKIPRCAVRALTSSKSKFQAAQINHNPKGPTYKIVYRKYRVRHLNPRPHTHIVYKKIKIRTS